MMMKKLALIFIVLMIAILALALFGPFGVTSITINGHEIVRPFGVTVGVWAVIVTSITLFCVAIVLSFVFVGVGLLVVGCLALVGVIVAAVTLPFLLPLLVPLFIVWVFCTIVRSIITG
jgi:predicted exporter